MTKKKFTSRQEKIQQVQELYRHLGADKRCLNEAGKYTRRAISYLKKLSIAEEKKAGIEKFAMELLGRNF